MPNLGLKIKAKYGKISLRAADRRAGYMARITASNANGGNDRWQKM